jgi:RHS repeat-associated protein
MLGSTRVVTDASGNACFNADYYPYGQENDYNTSCSPRYKFTGYEFDSETGNYYAYARYYDPRRGRFMSPDPLGGAVGNPQTLNRYAYVLNNPTTGTDPMGLQCRTANGCPTRVGGAGPFLLGSSNDLFGNTFEFYLLGILSGAIGYPGCRDWDCSPAQERQIAREISLLLGIGPVPGAGGQGRSQTEAPKQPLLVCAAKTANKLSLAQALGTNGKPGFINSVANGVFGNVFANLTLFVSGGGSTVTASTSLYNMGTGAATQSLNAVTGAEPIADLGLGAQSAGEVAGGIATEGLGGILTVGKLIYDAGTFAYGVVHCTP